VKLQPIKLYTISLLIVFATNLSAQNESFKIDSLRKILTTETYDTNKVNTLLKISFIYFNQNNNDDALHFAKDALSVATKIKDDSIAAECYFGIATIEGNGMDNRYEAIKNYYSALNLYEKMNNKLHSAICLSWIGFNYFYQENYDVSSDAFFKALKLCKDAGSDKNYTTAFSYIYLANIFLIQNELKKALTFDSIGLKTSIAVNNKQLSADAYSCMGDILIKQNLLRLSLNKSRLNSLNEAQENYFESLNNYREYGDISGIGDEFNNIASTYIKLNNFSAAKKYSDSALENAKVVQFKDNFEETYLIEAQLDSATGNFKHAFDSYKRYLLYRDSIKSEKNMKQFLQASLQYDLDKKEALAKAEQDKKDEEAKRIKNQQYFAIASLGVLVLAVVIVAFIQFRNNKQKQKANIVLEKQRQKVEATLSELKTTQQQLIQSEKMASLGELTAGIAHEIQNPLNFVNNFSEVNTELSDELQQEAERGNIDEIKIIAKDIRENSEKINHHGKRADAIVKGMLQHSRSGTGVKESTNINAIAAECLKLSYQSMRSKEKSFEAKLQTDFDDTVKKIPLVQQDIVRLLINLFNNSFYAVNEKSKHNIEGYEPTVTVSTKKINDNVVLTVMDNGKGIPQKVVDKIFQPFFTTKPTGQGTGLGLSLSYDIVKAHGGEIKVDSNEGEFTEFVIQLPISSWT
jgi:two-component system NtrC family sensor kinase